MILPGHAAVKDGVVMIIRPCQHGSRCGSVIYLDLRVYESVSSNHGCDQPVPSNTHG